MSVHAHAVFERILHDFNGNSSYLKEKFNQFLRKYYQFVRKFQAIFRRITLNFQKNCTQLSGEFMQFLYTAKKQERITLKLKCDCPLLWKIKCVNYYQRVDKIK